jgi:hypothetical protein
MNNKNNIISLIKQAWLKSSDSHRLVLEVLPEFKRIKNLLNHPRVGKGNWKLYPAVIGMEGMFLSIQLFSSVQNFLPADSPELIIYAITLGLGVVLALIFHELVVDLLPLIKSNLYGTFMEETKSGYENISLTLGANKRLWNNPRLAFWILFVMLLGLSVGRGILINIQSNNPQWDISTILGSVVASLVLLGIALNLAPKYLIWNHYRKVKKSLDNAVSARDQNLAKFRKLMDQLLNEPKVSSSLFNSTLDTSNELEVVRLYQELINDNGSYECLIPVQSQAINVTANGTPVQGIKVYGLFEEEKVELISTNEKGEALLKWRSYSSLLKVLSVGPHIIQDFHTSVQPLKIDIFDNVTYTPKID